MASQAERRAKTRQKLINAARRLFEKHGFDDVSVDQIVKAANVAKGTFYQYYQSKVDVLADMTRGDGAERRRQTLEAVANGMPAIPVLAQSIDALCQWFEEHEKIAEALIHYSFRVNVEEADSDAHHYNRTFIVALIKLAQEQGSMRTDVPAEELAKVLGGSLIASVLWWAQAPQPGALVKSMQHTMKVFLEGAKL